MKIHRLLPLLCLAALPLHAADGWVNLFNGRDLDGWEQHSGTAKYRIEDGAIVGTAATSAGRVFRCQARPATNRNTTAGISTTLSWRRRKPGSALATPAPRSRPGRAKFETLCEIRSSGAGSGTKRCSAESGGIRLGLILARMIT